MEKKLLIWGLIVILLLAGGWWFVTPLFKSTSNQAKDKDKVVFESPTPTPEPTPQLIRSDWSLEVLNGSGITGAAKKIADKLKDLGYPVIKVGNADKNNYEASQILVRKDLQDQIDLVLADIKDIVKIASSGGNLKDSTASARIILGKP